MSLFTGWKIETHLPKEGVVKGTHHCIIRIRPLISIPLCTTTNISSYKKATIEGHGEKLSYKFHVDRHFNESGASPTKSSLNYNDTDSIKLHVAKSSSGSSLFFIYW